MTKQELDAIRARCEAASKGPWNYIDSWKGDGSISHQGNAIAYLTYDDDWRDMEHRCENNNEPDGCLCDYALADGDFIAHARTDIPALLAEVEKLQAENKRLKKELVYHLARDPDGQTYDQEADVPVPADMPMTTAQKAETKE